MKNTDKKNAPARGGKAGTARGRQKQPARALRLKALAVLGHLGRRYPTPEPHLTHTNPWQLLVAVVLAAQCTDQRVNSVTPDLFARWPTPEALAGANAAELESVIRSTGFYHNKAKNLIGAARRIVEAYDGQVPSTMAELVTLPGVARKTANVVLFGGFGINEGLAVDTHVGRIALRLGLTTESDPVRAERELMALFPKKEWGNVNHLLVWFGRHVCRARSPLCRECEMAGICDRRSLADADQQF
jgi:endonuclease-3